MKVHAGFITKVIISKCIVYLSLFYIRKHASDEHDLKSFTWFHFEIQFSTSDSFDMSQKLKIVKDKWYISQNLNYWYELTKFMLGHMYLHTLDFN